MVAYFRIVKDEAANKRVFSEYGISIFYRRSGVEVSLIERNLRNAVLKEIIVSL